jgi:hypothetical protein
LERKAGITLKWLRPYVSPKELDKEIIKLSHPRAEAKPVWSGEVLPVWPQDSDVRLLHDWKVQGWENLEIVNGHESGEE